MKKSLLLSLMATAGMTAFAAQPVAETLESTNAVAFSAQPQKMAPQVATLSYDAKQSNVSKAVVKADGAIATPYYSLPGGVFMETFHSGRGLGYFYLTMASGKRYAFPVAVPAYQNLDWNYSQITSSPLPKDNMVWQYYSLTPTEGGYGITTQQVQKTTTLTTPAYPLGLAGWGTPILASVEGENQTLYTFGDVQMSYSRPVLKATDGLKRQTYARYDANKMTDYATDEESDSLTLSPLYSNYLTNWEKYGFYLPKPKSMYGIYGVNFVGVPFAYISDKLTFSVYKVAKRVANVWEQFGTTTYQYQLGEKIGGGYVSKDSMDMSYHNVLFVPVMEQVGEYEIEGYLNIDSDVVIMFDGYTQKVDASGQLQDGGDELIPDVLCTFNPRVENEIVYLDPEHKVYVSGNNRRFKSVGFPTQLMSGVNLAIGNLAAYDEEDYYTFKANVAGEEKTFEFEPSMDLNDESGFAIIEGEGAFDWYEYTIGAYDENTGLQTVTVKVNALPSGVTGRSSDLLVKIPGAEQVIKITQGEVSGIDSVVSDAAVVSSTYFDLMGRELNAEPETGMFIRQDVKADGTKVATKVVK